MKKLILPVLVVCLLLSNFILAQQYDKRNINSLSDRVSLNFEGGITYPRTDFTDDKISYIGQLSLDYFFPTSNAVIFGLRGYGFYGELKGSGNYSNRSSWPTITEYYTELASGGGGFTTTLNATDVFYPYIFIGGGYLFFNPRDVDGNRLPRNSAKEYSRNSWLLVGEIGSRFFIADNVSLNIAVNMDYVPTDDLDDVNNDISNGSDKDIFFTARGGISIYFGGVSDTDGDGVRDKYDQCPNTPPGVPVDEFGCPVDSDRDGVPDYIDQCPNTPVNILVDLNGCPVDSDVDGVPDYLDLCKDTPKGVPVDDRGCETDTDEDGVPDSKDLCPNTPVGTEVDKWGCPPKQEVVEPIKETEFVLSGAISFNTGSAQLLPTAYNELDKIIKLMKAHPETNWRIDGHTDNTGPYKLNKNLSLERAESVYNYFIKNGIRSERLIVNGYGPDYPIADNTTETGRTLNRRVSIKLASDKNNIEPVPNIDFDADQTYNHKSEYNVGQMIFTDGNKYCFQVSSWRSEAKAFEEANKYKAMGYRSFVVNADLPQLDGIWYRVRIGYYSSLGEVQREKTKLLGN